MTKNVKRYTAAWFSWSFRALPGCVHIHWQLFALLARLETVCSDANFIIFQTRLHDPQILWVVGTQSFQIWAQFSKYLEAYPNICIIFSFHLELMLEHLYVIQTAANYRWIRSQYLTELFLSQTCHLSRESSLLALSHTLLYFKRSARLATKTMAMISKNVLFLVQLAQW